MDRGNGETPAAPYCIQPSKLDSGAEKMLASDKVVCLKYRLSQFSEYEEVFSLISCLPQLCDNQTCLEASEERFVVILDKYQEQPQLLDPYLNDMITQLFQMAMPQENVPPTVMHQAFKYLYYISKVRGPKVVVRWFSHEVSDLVPVMQLIQEQDKVDNATWETRYILFLWLSIIIIIPFDLSRMDTPIQSCDKPQLSTVDRVYELAIVYLHVTDKTRDAAALMLAKFLSRPDALKLKLKEFLDWSFMILGNVDNTTFYGMPVVTGVLLTLSSLFKHAKREDVVEYAPGVLEHLSRAALPDTVNTQLRKLHIKLAQRLGMTFLKHRVASWRYQRGRRSLQETLASGPISKPSQTTHKLNNEDSDDSYDVPEEMEEVLGQLLPGLKDNNTIVRWSAAKGVGRLSDRLPRELADEVVQSLLELFSIRESDSAWHGGCLALAELGRRGLLLPQRLNEVVPVVLKALLYDERRGLHSVGSHVRDAACYICWSFARAYEPDELKPYVNAIASALVIVTVFDREVMCRRAASAAFQENVGRQGTFPHGIEILTAADYFTVRNRDNAYTNLSVLIAQYSEYTHPLIDHLVEEKLAHWDINIRELAAEALHNLAPRDVQYMKEKVLPPLLLLVTTSDISLRHGALRAVAELTFALCTHGQSTGEDIEEVLGFELIVKLLDIAPKLIAAQVFKGAVGEVMRTAVLKFIERMCACNLHVHGPVVVETWQSIIDENLPHTEQSIRNSAVRALNSLCNSYYCKDQTVMADAQANILPRYFSELTSPIHFSRMGFALALGGLPCSFVSGHLVAILDNLITCATIVEGCDPKLVEARRDAVSAISSICSTLTVSPTGSSDHTLCTDNIGKVYEVFFAALKDYTMDSRGDIGAVVRETAMKGIEQLSLKIVDSNNSVLLSPAVCKDMLCCLIQQANEKIDRMRGVAITTLTNLIYHTPPLPHIPHHSALMDLFIEKDLEFINWTIPQTSFPLTVRLLGMPEYSYHTLLGLVVSVGGLTESTVRQSSASLLRYLKAVSADTKSLESFSDPLLAIFKDCPNDSRIILPMFKTLDLLLSNGVFDVFAGDGRHPFPVSLLAVMKQEIKKCRDPSKMLSSINVFCGLLQFVDIRTRALDQIMILLCHHFPAVRRTTADQLYITLVTYDDIIDMEVSDDVMAILSNTAWGGDISSVRNQRNILCDLLKLTKPKLIVNKSVSKKAKPKDDLASYRDLVDRAGY